METAILPSTKGPIIAVFDFDGTLVENDSFFPFLAAIAGWPRVILVFSEALFLFVRRYLENKADPVIADHRTFIKAHMMAKILTGVPVAKVTAALSPLQGWRRWKEAVRQTLLQHHAAGHHVVIASGGLDLYLPSLLSDLPHHGIVCTEVGVENGVVTGIMTSGNCVRFRKAEMVKAYMDKHGPFIEGWGYGNVPHDLPMLALLKYRIII